MQNIPNGGRPIRFIRLLRPQVISAPALAPSAPIYRETYQEVIIPEIPSDKQ